MSSGSQLASKPGGGTLAARVLVALLACAYPLLIGLGLLRFEASTVAALVVAVLFLRAVLVLRSGPATEAARQNRTALALQLAPVGALAALGWLSGDPRFLLVLPVLVSLGLLFAFGRSLRSEVPIVERFARMSDPDLCDTEVAYCRSLTALWCAFFAANATLAGLTAAFAPLWLWTLYNGLLAYLAMALLFAGEFLVRRARFGRFGGSVADRVARSVLLAAGLELPAEHAPAEVLHAEAEAPSLRSAGWTDIGEKGSVIAVRFVVVVCLALGRGPIRLLMRAVALYYSLRDARLRRFSREFLSRVGEPSGFAAVYRHIRTFAFCSTDRIFLLRGDKHLFRISRFGRENGERIRRAGGGGIMVGAHFGSFEALRATAEYDDLPLSIVAYFENAAISNAVFESLDPELARRVIRVRPGDVSYLLEVRRRVREGELVAFLGDRAMPGTGTVEVDFLGAKARFPTGVFEIAATIGCPVVLIFGVYREPNVYEMHCEAFADRLDLPRRGGAERKREVVQRYASRLEHYVRSAPYNWFNFYDFWREAPLAEIEGRGATPRERQSVTASQSSR